MLLRVDQCLRPNVWEVRIKLAVEDTPQRGLRQANGLGIRDAFPDLGVRTVT